MKNKLKSKLEIWQYERSQIALTRMQEEVVNYLVKFYLFVDVWVNLFAACCGLFSASPFDISYMSYCKVNEAAVQFSFPGLSA